MGMNRTLLLGICAVLAMAGCARVANSKLNPFNWFGGARAETRFVLPEDKSDPRTLSPEVLSLEVVPYSSGALVKAVGRTPTQGWWDAELVARPIDADGVLVYDFRIFPPITDTPVGTNQSREVTVAASLSSVKLAQVRRVVVQGETNALSSSR